MTHWPSKNNLEEYVVSWRHGYLTGVIIAFITVGLAIYTGMLIERYGLLGGIL